MIITKIAKTKIAPCTKKHYEALGYVFKRGKTIEVPIEHLPKGSGVKIEALCGGECKKILTVRYREYIESTSKNILKDYCCKKCFQKIRTEHLLIPLA